MILAYCYGECMVNEPLDMPQNSIEQQLADQQNQQNQQNMSTAMSSSGNKDQQPEYAQVANIVSDLDRRLRTLEERYSNLRKKLQITDENLLDAERSFSKELRTFNQESLDVKKQVNEFSEKMGMLGNEMENVAQKSDLKVVEKYLDMWNPSNFVTRTELKAYLKSKGLYNISKEPDDNEE
jgi:predicted  nucleic acid-binding Zn-ribbon protein